MKPIYPLLIVGMVLSLVLGACAPAATPTPAEPVTLKLALLRIL